MNRSGWLVFSGVVLIIAGVMRVIDALWALQSKGALPSDLKDALLGHSLSTYGWLWLVAGIVLIAAGVLVLGPTDRVGAEWARWVGIIAAGLGAVSAIFLMPYFPVWCFLYILLAVAVIYGLSAHFGDEGHTTRT